MTTLTAPKPKSAIPAVGVHKAVGFDEYIRWDAMSNSQLSKLRRSPLHLDWYRQHGEDETDAFALGEAVHCAVLEPERFDAEYAIGPDVKLNTKAGKDAWAAFEAANPGKNYLRGSEGAECVSMRAAVWAHSVARDLLSGKGNNELSIVWNDSVTGVLCKGRVDRITSHEGYATIVDVKTTQDASPDSFSRAIAKYGYHRQAPMYLDGLDAIAMARGASSTRRRYIFIAIEKTPPYAVGVYELDEASMQAGRYEYQSLLQYYVRCCERNEWPGYTPFGVEGISVPRWALLNGGSDE